MNLVTILGTLTRDIELKYLPSGSAIGNFSIAVNKKYKNASGELVEKVSFFDVVSFGKQSETINQFFHRGSRILITGELEQQTWQDQQTQQNRSKVVIQLKSFDFIDRKSDNQQQGAYQQPQQQQQYQNGYQQQQQPTQQQVQHQQQKANGYQPQPQQGMPQEVYIDNESIPF